MVDVDAVARILQDFAVEISVKSQGPNHAL